MTRTPPIIDVRPVPTDDLDCRRCAQELAAVLAGRYLGEDDESEFVLEVTPDRIQLRWNGDPHGHPTRSRPAFVDFSRIDVRPGPGGSHRQPLARAVGLPKSEAPPRVVDATAGFGEDSWILAALGCEVLAIERNPCIAQLLRDGVERAGSFAPTIAERLKWLHGDAQELLPKVTDLHWRPDVIYLDPMFPKKTKSALEEKRMRMLRRLVGDDGDASELLGLARQIASRRVVVKRPLRAPYLAEVPASSHQGKSLRYDVYLTADGGRER